VDGEQGKTADVFPWEVSPALLARAQQYEAQGQVESYNCRANEFLNRVAKDEAVGPVVDTDLRVYPDMLGIEGRARPAGCLMLLLSAFSLVLAGPIAFLFAIPGFILSVLFYPVALLIQWYYRLKYDLIARRIRQNPKSPYAIKALFRLTELFPRYWKQGDIVQLIRVNVSRFLCGNRHVLLLVQDSPLPRQVGCLEMILPMLVGRRRIYFLDFPEGESAADRAAEAVSSAMGVKTVLATFDKRNRLQLV
jgi:hypothetical protein